MNQAECCPSCLQMPEAEAQLASKDRESVQLRHRVSRKINGPGRQALESTNAERNLAVANPVTI